jgi:hypothetical protein
MKRITLSFLALALSAPTGAALAVGQQYGDPVRPDASQRYDSRYPQNPPRIDTAQVTRVVRIDNRRGGYQRQECWNEQSDRYEDSYYRDEDGRLYHDENARNVGGAVIGGVVGGALGNQVGGGSGRTAATLAGVVVGAMIGSKVGTDGNDDRYRDNRGDVRRCRTTQDQTRYSGQRGYNVTYRYAGQNYQAVTRSRPGRNIRVLVDVRPQDEVVAYGR